MTPEQAVAKYINDSFELKKDYAAANSKREQTLSRAERYAGWTLPNIFPDEELDESDEMQNDYQSVGAQAVINLANKIMMTMFPPSRPFFRMDLTEEQKAEVIGDGLSEADMDAALAKQERDAVKELGKINGRVVLTDAIKHLIVVGNVCLYNPENENMQTYSLRDYVVKRDLRGNLIKLIIKETKCVDSLSDELAAIAMAHDYKMESDVDLYTCVQRINKDQYIVWQELGDVCYCHKKIGVYNKGNLPWNPLVWDLVRNKDYGTGLVENYAGDFHTLSTLAEAGLDYTTLLTDVKNLVDPTGMTNVREITEAPSGAYVAGREEDIFVHAPQVSSAADFLERKFESTARRIAAAFLLNSQVTRDAERVTAEEIRVQAQELEGSLGGVYSRLAADLQLRLAKLLLAKLNKEFKDIEPQIVTGLESLSRSSELDRYRAFFQDLIALSEVPEQVSDRLDFGSLISVLGAGHGIEYQKVLLDEKVVKEKQDARAEQLAQAAGMEAGAVASAQQGQK